jgi:hypothetical protein
MLFPFFRNPEIAIYLKRDLHLDEIPDFIAIE